MGPRRVLPVDAAESLARAGASAKSARRKLLATSSALALVGTTALFGISLPRPAVACTIDVTGPSGAVTNAANVDCINIHGATITGTVSNTGTLGSPTTGIAISGSTINGSVTDTGTIVGGIRNGSDSTINSTSTAISIGPVSTFAGGITNAGTISAGPGNAILINGASTFSGGIANSGVLNAQAFGIGIVNSGAVSGGISNSGTISSSQGFGVFLFTDSVFNGGIANSGTISGLTTAIYIHLVSTFTGGITNSGVLSAPVGIVVSGSGGGGFVTSLFSGGITNLGTISGAHAGIVVTGVAQFGDNAGGGITNSGAITGHSGIILQNIGQFGSNSAGGITNSGTISAHGSGAGINLFLVSTFMGGITNSGTISAGGAGVGIGLNTVLTFAGGISNSGTISAGLNGIGIGLSGIETFLGGITNSGTIKTGASGAGIVIDASAFSGNVSNSGTISGARTGIFVCNCTTFQNGAIINSGVISANTSAIDASAATSPVTVDQMAGTITGNILLPTSGGTAGTVNISGGTINGNIVGNGSDDTINFALGAGTFTYGAAYGFTGINQVNINSGTVVLNGANNATAINVNGGTLAGTGVLDPLAVTINAGGTLEPGTPGIAGGTLSITGNLIFQNGSFYALAISPSQHSLGAVTGGVTINGGTVVLTPNGGLGAHYSASQFAILTSTGTLTGTFDPNVTYSGSIKLSSTPTLSYDANDVFLTYANAYAILATPPGANTNQTNVASGINTAIIAGSSVPSGFQTLGNISGPTLLNALTQLSGEPATDADKGAFQLMTDFLNLLLDPTAGGGGNAGGGASQFAPEQDTRLPADVALAYAKALRKTPAQAPLSFDQRWTAWGSAYGGTSFTNGNAAIGSNNVKASDYGFAAGMEYHLTPDTMYGFGLAGGGTNWNLAQALGSGRSDAFQAGVYAKSHFGPAYLSAALAFANHWFTTDRIAMGDQLHASFTGQSYAARLEGGYRYAVPITGAIVGVTPYAALQAQDFHTPSYGEIDRTAGGFGLSYAAMNATDTRSELGARFDNLQIVGGMPLILRGRLAWAHDWFTNAAALNAAFQALPGSTFTVNGAAPPKNSALATAAAELHINANWTAIAKFDGEFGSGSQTYGGTGTLRYSW